MPHITTTPLMLAALWLLFFVYSFLGWIIESTYCSIVERRLLNRGFLNGPYIPIYGSGALVSTLLLARLGNPLAVFLAGGALSCALEYVTSYTMEKIYHARWWDYSDMPLNLGGRIWLGGFAEFGAGCTVVAYATGPLFEKALEQMPPVALYVAAALSLAVFLTDLAITHFGITGLRAKMDSLMAETSLWFEALRELVPSRPDLASAADWDRVMMIGPLRKSIKTVREKLRDVTPDVSLPSLADVSLPKLPSFDDFADSFLSGLNAQERRLMDAFPKMRPTGYRAIFKNFSRRVRSFAKDTQERREKRP